MPNSPKCKLRQKHFEYTASLLNGLRNKHNNSDAIVNDIVEILIPIYQTQNPRFKADLFRESCGVEKNPEIKEEL